MSGGPVALPPLTLVEDEYELVADLVCSAPAETEGVALLWRELQRALVVRRAAAPQDLVRPGSAVLYSDAATGALHYARLARPGEEAGSGAAPITSLLGAALIGLRQGARLPLAGSTLRLEWVAPPPSGRARRDRRTKGGLLRFRPQTPSRPVDPRPTAGYVIGRPVGEPRRRAKRMIVGLPKGLALAGLLAFLPCAASASTASEVAEKINWCQMKDPVGLTHLFSVKGDRLQLRDEGGNFVGVTSVMPLDRMVFDFQPRSFNPDYGAILTAKCKDGANCVEVKRDTGASWQAPGVQVFVQVECGKALDLAGKSLPN